MMFIKQYILASRFDHGINILQLLPKWWLTIEIMINKINIASS